MEKIIASAIRFYNLETKSYFVFTGVRHPDIFNDMYRLGIKYDKKLTTQGFLTNKGQFVDRYIAKRIAVNANQLIENPNQLIAPDEYSTFAELFSEDVW